MNKHRMIEEGEDEMDANKATPIFICNDGTITMNVSGTISNDGDVGIVHAFDNRRFEWIADCPVYKQLDDDETQARGDKLDD